MGAGVGISVHGTLRVATETACFAMPEAGDDMSYGVKTLHYIVIWLGGGKTKQICQFIFI